MNTPLEILKTHWNYNQFRAPQEEIINAIIRSEDCIVLLPTGGGKSICYQVPALLLEGVCIVISPLIALIKDQVNSLLEKNIKAIALTSQLNQEEIIIAFDNLQFGGFKFLYLSPEKLQSKFIQDKIRQLKVSLIAIDEDRLKQEFLIFIQKMDIDEELNRITSHIDEVRRLLKIDGQIGKKLDFMMQELNREANTLGSKSISPKTSQISIDLKVLIEQMREQIQNIE